MGGPAHQKCQKNRLQSSGLAVPGLDWTRDLGSTRSAVGPEGLQVPQSRDHSPLVPKSRLWTVPWRSASSCFVLTDSAGRSRGTGCVAGELMAGLRLSRVLMKGWEMMSDTHRILMECWVDLETELGSWCLLVSGGWDGKRCTGEVCPPLVELGHLFSALTECVPSSNLPAPGTTPTPTYCTCYSSFYLS